MEFGKLKTVNARHQWSSEAREFTPWLADNISELNQALGLELEVENVEVAAGPYSADILAKDTGTGDFVVIENQLEKTNHDHLGKSITYASVLDASTIIWIATNFTEEHKKALDWLNDHTNEEISFYGVQLELWQIDESRAAIRFNVVSKPNMAVRQASRSKNADNLTERKKFQLEFWNKLREKLSKTNKIHSLQTARPQYWFDITLGNSNYFISNTCNTDDNTVGVRIYIRNKVVDSLLPLLLERKTEIENLIGQQLVWNPNPTNRDKVIMLNHQTDFNDPAKINEAVDWMVAYTLKFKEVFVKVLKEIKNEAISTMSN